MTNRNYGIDLLRILSMYLIVILHVLGQGGILGNVINFSPSYQVAWFLEIAAYCSVNCYALISGYVGLNSKYKISNVVYLWCKVLYYSVIISILFMFVKNDFNLRNLFISFLPVCSRRYWYVTAYFCLYTFMPILNIAISKMSNMQLYLINFAMIFNFSIIPTILGIDIYNIQSGYSGLWLIILYFLGASLKKLDLLKKLSIQKSVILYFSFVLIMLLSKNVIQYVCIYYFGIENNGMMFITYISPTIICEAIMLLNVFSKLKISDKMKKLIKSISSLSFGVYLIHVHPSIYKEMKGMFVSFLNKNILMMTVSICLSAFIIFVLCLFIDLIREKLFCKLHIREKLLFLDKLIEVQN